MGVTILPQKFYDALERQNACLAAIASHAGGIKITSWADAQALVRRNMHHSVAVADQLVAERATKVDVTVDGGGITGATVDMAKFLNAVGEVIAGVAEITYDGATWRMNDTPIVLANYGLTVVGTPAEDDRIIVTVTATEQCFDVMDHDTHTPVNPALTHTMPLLLHDIAAYGTIPFCPSQLLYYTDVELPAGNYKFTLDHGAYGGGTAQDGTYMFETDTAIPADGGIRHTTVGAYRTDGYEKANITSGKVIIYGPGDERAIVKDNISCSEWDGTTECTDLGTFTARSFTYHTADGKHNFTERNAYGSNRWKTSAVRQWLNSDAAPVPEGSEVVSNWYTRQTVFDRLPGGAKSAGYLYGLDPELKTVICPVKVRTALPDPDKVPDGDPYEETEDKVWLASMTEVYGSSNGGVAEGSQFEYWKDTTNAAKIKYQGSTARYWWLRGPYPGYANYVRYVTPPALWATAARTMRTGLSPACVSDRYTSII
jgi:hypothetical protein